MNHGTNHTTATSMHDAHGEKVLLVEPDAALRMFLKRELGAHGLHVCMSHDGEHALQELRKTSFHMVIMDMDLQGIDGMSLLKTMRSDFPNVAVMVLTRRARTEDIMQALERGAHDYMVKPFKVSELQARVRGHLRRMPAHAHQQSSNQAHKDQAHDGMLCLSKRDRRVKRGDRQIDLTPREFALLEHLVENKGKAVSRSTLMQEVWKTPLDPSTNIIDVYMKYLRDKIDGTGEKKLIRTIRGVGYMLDSSAAAFA